jgi:hypothetical protein
MKASSIAPIVAASLRPSAAPLAAASMTETVAGALGLLGRLLSGRLLLRYDASRSGSRRLVPRLGLQRLGQHDLGHQQRTGRRHEAGRDEVVQPRAEQRVAHEHRPRDRRQPAHHDGEELRAGQPGDVRADQQRRLGLPDEDVGGGVDRLLAAGPQQPSEPPAEDLDDPLQHAEVVEHRGQRREEDDHRQHLEGHDGALVLRRQHRAEQEADALARGVDDRLDAGGRRLQRAPAHRPRQHQDAEAHLQRQRPDHGARPDRAPIGRAQPGDAHQRHHPAGAPQHVDHHDHLRRVTLPAQRGRHTTRSPTGDARNHPPT